jgi:uncharacterized protein
LYFCVDVWMVTEAFIKGINQFNRREFFDCHDTWEEIWNDTVGASRSFYQGMIQVAVGYYHALNGNFVGAEHLFSRALAKLESYLPHYQDVDLALLLPAVREHHAVARDIVEGKSSVFDERTIPRIASSSHSPYTHYS